MDIQQMNILWSLEAELLKIWSIAFFLFFFLSLLGAKFGRKEEGGDGKCELNLDIGTLKILYSFIDISNLIF